MGEKDIVGKWKKIVDALKDGKSVKIRRNTVAKGVTKPFGTLTREGRLITFEPARGARAEKCIMQDVKMPQRLTDMELLSAFGL